MVNKKMSHLKNSEITQQLLQTVVKVIGRRSTIKSARITVDSAVRQIQQKYDFLKYITIQDITYSEKTEIVNVSPEINSVETNNVMNAVNEIFDIIGEGLIEKSDFFVLKEISEEFEDKFGPLLNEFNINLNYKQFEQLDKISEEDKIKSYRRIRNSEVVEDVIKALIRVVNKILPEKQAIMTINNSIGELKGTYDYVKYIELNDTSDSNGIYIVNVSPEIENIVSVKIAEALQKLIEKINNSIKWTIKGSFLISFINELGEEKVAKIERIGVNLKHIKTKIMKRENEELTKKILDALVMVVGEKTSEGFAIVTIHNVINEIAGRYHVLQNIKIDESLYSKGVEAITISPEINNVDPYELGKPFTEILKKTQDLVGNKFLSFIEDYKNKLGHEYLSELEKIRVNIHFLELRN